MPASRVEFADCARVVPSLLSDVIDVLVVILSLFLAIIADWPGVCSLVADNK